MSRNVFAFEFYRRAPDGSLLQSLGEYVLTVGPQQYIENYRYRITAEATYGDEGAAVAVVDAGNGPNTIELVGEFHLPHRARPPSTRFAPADRIADGARDAATDILPLGGLFGLRSGAMEFQDFIGLLYHTRDRGYFSGDEQAAPIASLFAHGRFNYGEYGLVYRDYARDRCVEVVPDRNGIRITRSIEDTNTIKFQMALVVVREHQRGPVFQRTKHAIHELLGMNPLTALNLAIGKIETVLRAPLFVSDTLYLASEFAEQFLGAGERLLGAWGSVRTQFAEDGKLIDENFSAMERDLGTETERTVSLDEFERTLADFRGKLERFGRMVGRFLVAPAESLEADSLRPDADFTEFFLHPVYEATLSCEEAVVRMEAALVRARSHTEFHLVPAAGGATLESLAELYLGDRGFAGDLGVMAGEEALMNGVLDVIDTPQGALPAFSFFGNSFRAGISWDEFVERGEIVRLLEAIQADPRVRSARVAEAYGGANVVRTRIVVTSVCGGECYFLL